MTSSLSRCFVLATFSWNIASKYVVFISQPEDLRASVLSHKFLFPVGSSSLFRVMERRRQWHSGVTTIREGNKTAALALDDCFISVKRQAICASVSIETCRDCVHRPCGNRALFHTTRYNRLQSDSEPLAEYIPFRDVTSLARRIKSFFVDLA